MSKKSNAEQYLIDRDLCGTEPWFDKENTYYSVKPSLIQEYANQEVNGVLMLIKNNVKTMDDVNRSAIKSLIDHYKRQ